MIMEKFSPGKDKKKLLRLTIQDITLIGMMVAVIEVCKMAMTFLPNIELTTFWVIMFTLFFWVEDYLCDSGIYSDRGCDLSLWAVAGYVSVYVAAACTDLLSVS